MMEASNLRLKIVVGNKFYYDVGVRKFECSNQKPNLQNPRYLEDFIAVYGKENVKIASYGKYWRMRYAIRKLLK